MPPKRAAKGGKSPASKKVKTEDVVDTFKDAITKLKAADTGKKTHKIDDQAPSHLTVHTDFDAMLNQTNIGHNNNKYYVIQLLKDASGKFYTWNRWGRVGEPGASKLSNFPSLDDAVKDFEKKFRDKTKNSWDDRANFQPAAGKYTLIEMGDEDEIDAAVAVVSGKPAGTVAKCTLDLPTQQLVKLLFDNDMFRDAMANMNIDVKKMPLGKLSKTQIAKGFEVLEEIEGVLSKKKKGDLMALSSKFYTVVPQSFGRQKPPTISTDDMLQAQKDVLTVLGDIELAQSLQKNTGKAKKNVKLEPHPLDVNYELLMCDLNHLDPKSLIYKMIETYVAKTGPTYRKLQILDIWEVNRKTEAERFKAHDGISNRKLLWHGTNVAVVAAILKSGLRIMPHSGGRVGKGIYFASENDKSAGYVGRTNDGIGIMFLGEVALGREKTELMGCSGAISAGKGFDSIVARGVTEPDPKKEVKIKIGSHDVVVPQGSPIKTKHSESRFSQSEYLVYKESQVQLRYLLKLKF